jgi:prepilin-type N-terminal cleavage/methylation domain-containing protein
MTRDDRRALSRKDDLRSLSPKLADEAGFSLAEMLVALAVSLVVSGAVFGLLGSAQNAFRREPMVADRQAAIRLAMDRIQRDIATAGLGMVPFVQAFTDGLDGGGPLTFPAVIEPAASRGERTDVLEIVGNDGRCPRFELCAPAGPGGASLAASILPVCLSSVTTTSGSFVYVGDRGAPGDPARYAIEFSRGLGSAPACVGGTRLSFAGTTNHNPEAGFCGGSPGDQCTFMMPVQVVGYAIAADSDGMPALFRSDTGWAARDGTPYGPPPGGNWELIARGIEDLQVEYLNGSGIWSANPGVVAAPNYETIVQQVRVTLSARALSRGLQGETASAAGIALRGQLTTVTAPRAALSALKDAAPAPLWE